MLAAWQFLAVSERHTTMRLASSNSDRAAEDCRQDGPFSKPRRVFGLQPIIFSHLSFVDIEERQVSHLLFASTTISSATSTNSGSVTCTCQPWYWKPGYMEIFKLMPTQWWPASALLLQPLAIKDWKMVSGDQDKGSGTCGFKATWIEVRRMWLIFVGEYAREMCSHLWNFHTHVRKIMLNRMSYYQFLACSHLLA